MVRAKHHETHRARCSAPWSAGVHDEPVRAGDHSIELTMTVLGEDVDEYLEAGDTFALWRGHDIGQGLISRRLHTVGDGP